MDPLSDVLALLKPRSHVSSGFHAGGQWSIRFTGQSAQIKCYAVTAGGGWLVVDDVPGPVHLAAGDCFVLPSGRSFRLASDIDLKPVPASTIFPPARAGGAVILNDGGGMSLVGSRFAIGGEHAAALMRTLPAIVHIRGKADQAALRWAVERMMEELRDPQPGGNLVAQHLAHLMLVQALRLYLADGVADRVGWFPALADRQMCAAISAMHGDPARRWTVQDLAVLAGMSRSAFAARFKATVGETPMDYLTRWRMLLASERLSTSNEAVSAIAFSLGYESEGAFSTAFKREMGCSPRKHGRNCNGTPQ